jgi:hypothetical protein
MRAAKAGDYRAQRAVDVLEERASYGDAWAHKILFQAKTLDLDDSVGAAWSGGVRTEHRGNTTMITLASPSASSNFFAYILGAVTIAAGILLGVFLPRIIRRQNNDR